LRALPVSVAANTSNKGSGAHAGLKQSDDQIEKLSSPILDRRLVQVVLARSSVLLGKTVRATNFRKRFDAAIVALHRAGQRLRTRIGDIELQVLHPSMRWA
jgi:K+/H+ antiporter YhaU regulatory subunit KhtT